MSTTNKQSKSILAQLLATEDISVTHDPKAQTAMFDVKNRNLVLPVWKDMTDDIYDMLVGHEVGHALFTPYDRIKEDANVSSGPWCADAQIIGGDSHGHIAMAYLNIVEDARIERLIKQKFPGLRRDFVSAYSKLNEKDFFGVKEKPPTVFIDKVNLYFKIGVSAETEIGISFSAEEQVFVDRIALSTTYDEVVNIVKDIWEYEIENNNKSKYNPKYSAQSQSGESNASSGYDRGIGIRGGMGGKNLHMPHMSETHMSYLESFKNMIDDDIKSCKYLKMPTVNLKNTIITAEEIQFIINSYNKVLISNTPRVSEDIEMFAEISRENTRKFIKESTKSVSVLVKQFEMKKAADAHKRSLVAKTGILDTIKMIKYKFDDDIFARHCTIRAGKNHGIVMFVDWSSSMSNTIDDTVRQCFLIALFCKKCNIPFDVYAFSSVNIRAEINKNRNMKNPDWDSDLIESDYENSASWNIDRDKENENKEYCSVEDFSLLHFVSSKMSMKDMTNAMSNMFQITSSYMSPSSRTSYYLINPVLRLSGTPLAECILSAIDIVNQFRAENKVQVVSTILLTDGEGCSRDFNGYSKEKQFCINEKKKITYDVSKFHTKEESECRYFQSDTKILLKILALETQSNVLGFYLLDSSAVSVNNMITNFMAPSAKRQYDYPSITKHNSTLVNNLKCDSIVQGTNIEDTAIAMCSQYKKEGYFIAHPQSRLAGYKELYVIRGSSLSSDTEVGNLDGLAVGIGVTQVRTAFRKQMKGSTTSKNLLNRIIDNIAV